MKKLFLTLTYISTFLSINEIQKNMILNECYSIIFSIQDVYMKPESRYRKLRKNIKILHKNIDKLDEKDFKSVSDIFYLEEHLLGTNYAKTTMLRENSKIIN